jgi:hypothetical protein
METEIELDQSCPGRNPPPGRPVLALTGVTPAAKHRRPSERAGALSLENLPNEGADAIPPAEGHAAAPNGVGPGTTVLPGSKTSARSHMLSAREPGDLGSASS